MPKLIADHPDYVFTTSTRPWNIKPGDVMPGIYIGIWKTSSDNRIGVLAMRDTPWLVGTASRSSRPTAWPTAATPSPAASSAPRYWPTTTRRWISSAVPVPKPLDMSDAVCRPDYLSRRGGKCVDLPRFSPLHGDLHAHHDQRTRTSDRGRHRLVVTPGGRASGDADGRAHRGVATTVATTVWPGSAYPLGATYDGAGTNFSLFSEVAEKVELCLIAQGRHRGARRARRGRRLRLARLPARPSPRASATGSGCTARGIRPPGIAAIRSKLLLDPYGKSFHGDFDFSPGAVLLRPATPTT